MADFKLDPITGDLSVSGGLTLITSFSEEARQRLQLALGLNLGEWFLQASYGLPWLENPDEDFATSIRYMLGDKFPDSPRFIASTLDKYIKSLSYVNSMTSSYTFDRATREFTYTPLVKIQDGSTLTLTPFQVNL
jgi:hypothetical protein